MDKINAAGKYDFKSNKEYEIAADRVETKGIKNKKDFLGNNKVNLKDGINAQEAEYIIVELEDEEIISDNDTKITDKELKKFLKTNGQKVNKNSIASVKKIIKSITEVWGNTKDGKIQNTEQGAIAGDCWLLSGVNGLNYTKEGKKIIQDIFEYEKDGTTVHFKGVGDIFVSNEDLENAKAKSHIRFSRGDDDMKILECATEQVREKIYNGDIVLSDNMPSFIKYKIKEDDNSGWGLNIDSGQQLEMLYYMTGKTGEKSGSNMDKKAELLNNFTNNKNKDYVLYASKNEDAAIKDIEGNKILLNGPHAYAVKSADEDTVTVTNPHDSSVEIKLSKDTFLNVFDNICGCDLSDNNPIQNYKIKTTSKTIKNKDGSKTKVIKDKNGKVLQELTFKNNKITAKKEHKTIPIENGEINETCETKYDKKSRKKSQTTSTTNSVTGEYGNEKVKYKYNKKGEAEEFTTSQTYNKNNVLIHEAYQSPKKIKIFNYNDGGKITEKQYAICNNSGNITKLTVTKFEYDENGQKSLETKNITNNKTGEHTEIITKYENGKKVSETTNKYDKNWNLSD